MGHVSKQTAQKLRAGVEEVRRHYEQFDMIFWIRQYDSEGDSFPFHDESDVGALDTLTYECRTTLCYASYLLLTAPKEFRKSHANMTISHAAAEYAGLTMDQMWALFNTSNWPTDMKHRYHKTIGTPEAVDALADRVEHFIEEGR